MGLNLCISHLGREVYQNCLNKCCILTFDLFTARSSLLPYAFVWEKPLKILFSKTEDAGAESLHISSETGGLPKLLKENGRTLTFDLFTVRSVLLPYAFVWEKYSEFQMTSSLEPLGQFCTNYIWSLLRLGNERLLKWSRFIDQDGRHAHIW